MRRNDGFQVLDGFVDVRGRRVQYGNQNGETRNTGAEYEKTSEQYTHGIWTKLVRESTLTGEPDLLVDLGIYGTRAVGFQELDDHGRTVRFTLSFEFAEILAAERRWERLSVYSTSYQKLLDQQARPG